MNSSLASMVSEEEIILVAQELKQLNNCKYLMMSIVLVMA